MPYIVVWSELTQRRKVPIYLWYLSEYLCVWSVLERLPFSNNLTTGLVGIWPSKFALLSSNISPDREYIYSAREFVCEYFVYYYVVMFSRGYGRLWSINRKMPDWLVFFDLWYSGIWWHGTVCDHGLRRSTSKVLVSRNRALFAQLSGAWGMVSAASKPYYCPMWSSRAVEYVFCRFCFGVVDEFLFYDCNDLLLSLNILSVWAIVVTGRHNGPGSQ